MMFRTAILASFLAAMVSSKKIVPGNKMSARSKAGKRLMSKAKRADGRALENNERENFWMVDYSIKYLSCSSLVQVAGREGGGGEGESKLYTQNLVKFGLCKTGESCSSCKGEATYVVDMLEFVDAYTEMKLEEQERMCENIRENCYMDNCNDDEACENQCYISAGQEQCIQYEGDEDFEVQRYLECAELENGNNNNNNNNGNNYNYNNANQNQIDIYRQYFSGPYCDQDGHSIRLGVFLDEGCTARAQDGVFEALNYGKKLPFSDTSMVQSDCISCERVDEDANNNNNNNNNGNNNNNNNNNNNQNQEREVLELCEQSTQEAARCEANLVVDTSNWNNNGNNNNNNNNNNRAYFYPDTTGCTYINDILPKLEKASRSIASGSSASESSGGATTFFMVFFAISTIVLGAYSFFLYRKVHRARVSLSHSSHDIA